MMNIIDRHNLSTQLQQAKDKKIKIESKMSSLKTPPQGTADFMFHYMKKQKDGAQEQINKINGQLRPDIIA